jgi:pantoate--beta-alanine ligase
MKTLRSPRQMRRAAEAWRRQGLSIGVVPTMGALHAGHASLIARSAAENDRTVVTIFVNPLQFGPREDFRRYPRAFARDAALCRRAGAAAVFAPSAAGLYPPGFQTGVDPGPLARRWEGESRPGHFRGVATVVTILLNATAPDRAYFGQKDYQQARIIARLVEDLRLPVRVRVLPTVREPDGLAMSSRNAYLSPVQRRQALALIRGLRDGRAAIRAGARRGALVASIVRRGIARSGGAVVDYAAVVDAASLEPLSTLRGRVALLVAARVGRTRLIDNLLVDVP